MSEPRAPLESEIPNLIDFLDAHLRPGQEWSIAAEYPQVFRPVNSPNIRVVTEGDRIVAHAAMNYLLVKNTFGLSKVAAIGSVVTDPNYRNQGLSRKILQNCIDSARAENADFAVLWTDLYDFYRKLDFELAGSEISFVLNSEWNEPLSPGERIVTGPQISSEALLRVYSQHTCSTLRTAEDIRRYLAIPKSKVWSLWSPQNELLAYAVQGKGMDLDGYIHEWGGQVPHLMKLFAHARHERGAAITVIAPSHAQNLIRELRKKDVVENSGYLGMIRPIQLGNIFFKLKRRAHQLGMADFKVGESNGVYVIGRGQKLYEIGNMKLLTRLLFGPVEEGEIPEELSPLLPMPMWIWGWDSV